MAFRRLMGVKMPYEQQVLVYAICRNYETQDRQTQDNILRLCREAGRQYAPALFELVTGDRTVESVAMEHYMSATVLYACRRKLYERWFEK